MLHFALGSSFSNMDWPVALLLIVLALLLVGSLVIYLVSAIRSRGKKKPARDALGNGNFLGVSPGGGRGPAVGGAPFGAPGAFAVPEQPHRLDEEREPDPRRR